MSSGADILGTNAKTAGAAKSARRPRILYAAGSGDVLGTYRHWKNQNDDPTQISMTYSGQFFDLCQRLGWDGIVLVHNTNAGVIRDERFVIRQTPPPRFHNGAGYHFGQLMAALRIIVAAIRYRACVVVAASGASHWFPLAILPMLGIKVVPALHCVLWPKYRKPGRLWRFINRLDAIFFAYFASAMLTASGDIDEQVIELTSNPQKPRLLGFLPTYRQTSFGPPTAPAAMPPMRVLYAGRIEAEKGVFDLLMIAGILDSVEFDICGDGSALAEMKRRAEIAGLSDRIRFHGHCERPVMMRMFQQSHVVLVPTTTEFVEGFNQVVAEGILAGRPVVTSEVCPAVKYLGDAVVTVPPDNVKAYAQAIDKLAKDPAFYQRCAARCDTVRGQFFDEQKGWGAALESALTASKSA